MDVSTTPEPAVFSAAAEKWLLGDPVSNNLLLSHATDPDGQLPGDGQPAVFAWVSDGGQPVGAAWVMSPYRMTISAMPAPAAAALAEELAGRLPELPGVNGPEESAGAFAERWREVRGGTATRERDQWLMRCDSTPPASGAAGAARPARADEVERIGQWYAAVMRDSGLAQEKIARHTAHMARTQFAGGRLIVWEVDGEPVGAAGWAKPIGGVVRPSGVFVSPDHRNGGYAGALLGEVTARALAAGAQACVCTHFLDYAAMQAVVERVGYRRVRDLTEYRFN
ncbi:GNAT family N-acetyltransferase [Kitasatospora viridis]|uniref:Acetyltransferase (GNAT) family protein n=1 Tax=Kitasatospora viridis TaxID=281105 RepID=A0A561UCF1_9ACTN|nr:GNAT family N-acetyltransferase [Kitasatospora viridis]TWF97037.1 acetyltransferase (GNAT) family protein [Kitasatospora viridis]